MCSCFHCDSAHFHIALMHCFFLLCTLFSVIVFLFTFKFSVFYLLSMFLFNFIFLNLISVYHILFYRILFIDIALNCTILFIVLDCTILFIVLSLPLPPTTPPLQRLAYLQGGLRHIDQGRSGGQPTPSMDGGRPTSRVDGGD